tara:strand:- start:680 stop:1420 length:741 start_codon:yes stop_codon:yes gene_type:complete
MSKPIKVVILPTEDKNLLVSLLMFGKQKLHLCETILPIENEERYVHLYITVSLDVDPIKVGDWGYDTIDNAIFQMNNQTGIDLSREVVRKIIATTDPKLTSYTVRVFEKYDVGAFEGTFNVEPSNLNFYPNGELERVIVNSMKYKEDMFKFEILQKGTPQLQQSFIKEFIANPDGEFVVEYANNVSGTLNINTGENKINTGVYLIYLNEDNTVNLSLVKKCVHPFKRLHWVGSVVYCNECNTTLNK